MLRIKCPECNGEGGHPSNEDRPVKTSYDWDNGETYHSNWTECDECNGSGEVEADEEE